MNENVTFIKEKTLNYGKDTSHPKRPTTLVYMGYKLILRI